MKNKDCNSTEGTSMPGDLQTRTTFINEIVIIGYPIFDSAIEIIYPSIIQKSDIEIKQIRIEILKYWFGGSDIIPSITDEDLIEFFEGYKLIIADKGFEDINQLNNYIQDQIDITPAKRIIDRKHIKI